MVDTYSNSLTTATSGTAILAASADLVMLVLPVLGSMLLFYGIFQVIVDSRSSSRKKVQDRLRGKRTEKKKDPASIMRRGAMQESQSLADTMLGKLEFVPRIQTKLNQADLDWGAAQFLMNLCGGAIAASVALIVLGYHPLLAVGCGGALLVMPMFWLNMRRAKRIRKITEQLPDVFDMMSQALQAGHSLAGAIQLIYEQMPAPIANEFGQVYHEQNLGIRVEDALRSMSERVDSLDVRFFVTAVMIQRQTGGDLAEVLTNISGVIRERIELSGLVRGLTAEGRLSGWVLFALPILVFLAVMYLNPEYSSVLFEEPIGRLMLIVAGGMQIIGLAMIRWIVNIKV